MNSKLDKKINSILDNLDKAQKRCEQFHAHQVNPGERIQPMDVFEMGNAFATRQKLYIELNLARAEKYPSFLTEEKIEQLVKEKLRLERNIRAYKNCQFPSQYHD